MTALSSTAADNLIGEWADTLNPDTDEHRDLDTALHQNARLWGGRDHTFDQRMRPLTLLHTVARLRHWQTASAAPATVKAALGALAQHIRDRAAVVHDADLLDEVDRLRAENAAAVDLRFLGPGGLAIVRVHGIDDWWVYHPDASPKGRLLCTDRPGAVAKARELADV